MNTARTVFYASVGGDLARYEMDVNAATLTKLDSVSLPVNIQYAWPHPSGNFLRDRHKH
jgi:hypothetical protein